MAASVPAAAAEKDPAGRITTTIGTWFGTVTGGVVYLESSAGTTLFTIPAPGTSGPIEYPDGEGGSLCLSTSQSEPYFSLKWRPAALDPCQDVTTVVDPVSGTVGFMAADGPYAGRYLGDRSRGGLVDWDLQTFYGTDVPAIVPRVPVPVDDARSTVEGRPVTIDVLGNDGDTTGWTVSAGTPPRNGTVAVNADGTVAYTPNIGYVGDDSFTYTVTDGNGATGTATVTITVTPVGAPPAESEPAPSVPATPEPKPNSQGTSAPAALADTGTEQVAPMLGLVGLLIAAGAGLTLINRRKNA